MNAAFMSCKQHEGGIHNGPYGGCRSAESAFPVRAAAGGEARAEHDQPELTGNTS
jgi:hypothetical protein